MEALADNISYRQLLKWACYFKHEDGLRGKLDYYMANLTAWVASKATGKAQKVEPFYLDSKPAGTDLHKMSSDDQKQMWLGFFKIKNETE